MQDDFILGSFDDIEDDDFEIIPTGEYKIRAVSIEFRYNNTRTGNYLNVCFEVTEGKYSGSKFFEIYNVKNTSYKAVEISLKNIKKWIVATGHNAKGNLTVSLIMSLEGKQFIANIGLKTDETGRYPDKNFIKTYKRPINKTDHICDQQAVQFQQHPASQQQFMQQGNGKQVQSDQQQWQGGNVDQTQPQQVSKPWE